MLGDTKKNLVSSTKGLTFENFRALWRNTGSQRRSKHAVCARRCGPERPLGGSNRRSGGTCESSKRTFGVSGDESQMGRRRLHDRRSRCNSGPRFTLAPSFRRSASAISATDATEAISLSCGRRREAQRLNGLPPNESLKNFAER